MNIGTLRDRINETEGYTPSWREKTRMMTDCARGFNYLYELDILHNDFKSHNFFAAVIGGIVTIKIGDFGFSCMSASAHLNTGKASPFWAAPELLQMHPPTHKSNVYAFGTTLWEIVDWKKRSPYYFRPEIITLELLRNHLNFISKKKSRQLNTQQFPNDCPQTLKAIIGQCWLHDPAKRKDPSSLFHALEAEHKSMSLNKV